MAASTKDVSAQQAQHAPVRLLIAERSENAAYQFDSLLRDAGIATRPEIIDLPMAVDKLAHADMMLCNASLPEVNQLLPRLVSLAPRVPIILVCDEDSTLDTTEGMELGAADVVAEGDSRHLVLVVKRELEHVCHNIQYRQMKKALAEAEQRCQLLLESSRAAIAYVHEGMHIHANEHYLQLFGFDDADDLLGLPLIDLMESDSAATLKDTLKAFRAEEEETEFEFTGVSTNGDTIAGSMTLAAAEYEGEHCLQVTVRPQAGAPANLSLVADQNAGDQTGPGSDADVPADDVPVLDADAIVTPGAAAPQSSEANGSETDSEVDAAVDGIDFELELDDEAAAEVAADAEADDGEQTTVDLEVEAFDAEPGTEDTTTEDNASVQAAEAATPAGDYGRILPLPEFLQASQTLAAANEGQFVSVFVAQVDGYEDLQRAFGLAGVDDACRKVEATLLERVEAPVVQISPSQWAMLICAPTREEALTTVDAHRAAVEKMMFEIREKTVRPTCTFAGAIFSSDATDNPDAALEATLDSAITALRSTLESSEGNTVHLPAFESAEQEYDDEANRVLSLITEAIENQSFTLLFQPIISLRGDSDEHYEVFLRMSDRGWQSDGAWRVSAHGHRQQRCRQDRPLGDPAVHQDALVASGQWSQHPVDDQPDRKQRCRSGIHPVAGRRHQGGPHAFRRCDLPDHRTGRVHLHPADAGVRGRTEAAALPRIAVTFSAWPRSLSKCSATSR